MWGRRSREHCVVLPWWGATSSCLGAGHHYTRLLPAANRAQELGTVPAHWAQELDLSSGRVNNPPLQTTTTTAAGPEQQPASKPPHLNRSGLYTGSGSSMWPKWPGHWSCLRWQVVQLQRMGGGGRAHTTDTNEHTHRHKTNGCCKAINATQQYTAGTLARGEGGRVRDSCAGTGCCHAQLHGRMECG